MIPADNTHMIVLPGGGYSQHAAHEAEPVATWLTCKRAFSGTYRAARLLSRAQAEVERLPARPRSARPGRGPRVRPGRGWAYFPAVPVDHSVEPDAL